MSTQLAIDDTGTPPITDADMAAIRYWTALEPDPCFRCLHCDWVLPTNNPADRVSSQWFRAEAHAAETGHDVGVFYDRDDPAPAEEIAP